MICCPKDFDFRSIFSLTVLTIIVLVPLTSSVEISTQKPYLHDSKCGVTIAVVLCRDDKISSEKESTVFRDFGRQVTQTIVLLRSITLAERFSPDLSGRNKQKCVHVILLANHVDIFEFFVDNIERDSSWDPEFSQYLEISYVPAVYPKEHDWMTGIYRPCATIRLFLDKILPDSVDSVIYTDTDIIYLKSLQYLWREFNHFTTSTIAGLIPEYHNPFFKRRDYNPSAYNSGIMLMNLTRMREVDWSRKIGMVAKLYLENAQWADQDILVIYFQHFPSQLHDISCDWNFAPRNCRFGQICAPNGISAVHGLAGSFVKPVFEIYFKTLFNAYRHTPLNTNFSLRNFTSFIAERAWNNHDPFHTSWHSCHVRQNWADLIIASVHRFELFESEFENYRVEYRIEFGKYNNISKHKVLLPTKYPTTTDAVTSKSNCIPIVLPFCEYNSTDLSSLNQTMKYLKAFVGSACVKLIIVSTDLLSSKRFRRTLIPYDGEWQKQLQVIYVQTRSKARYEWIGHISRPCGSLPLLYPELLSDEDVVIHFDLMQLMSQFPRTADMVWNSFTRLSNKVLVASFNRETEYPGNQAAIMAMNLTRMRNVGFSNVARIIGPYHRDGLGNPRQDIMGIYFTFFPEQGETLTDLVTVQHATSAPKVKPTKKLSISDKKKLAGLVKEQTSIWSLNDPLHCRPDAVFSAWTKVSEAMGETFISIKYIQRRKSGDPAEEEDSSDAEEGSQWDATKDLESWNLWDAMKFVVESKAQRKTMSSMQGTDDAHDVSLDLDLEEGEVPATAKCDSGEIHFDEFMNDDNHKASGSKPSKSNYAYAMKPKKMDSGDKLSQGLLEFMDFRKQQVKPSVPNEELKYHTIYANLDRMLKQLPELVVEDLNFQFIQLTLQQLKHIETTFTLEMVNPNIE